MNLIERERLARRRSDINFAHGQVARAVRKGTLVREPCYCGETKVEGHHPDYSKPLEVIWACKKHHVMLDKMKREADLEKGQV